MILNNRGETEIHGNADIVLAELAGLVHELTRVFNDDPVLILDVVALGLDRNYGDIRLMMNRIYRMLDERGYGRKDGRR